MHISDDIAAIEERLAEPRYAHSDQAVLPKEAVNRVLEALKDAQRKARESALVALTCEGQAWAAYGATESAEAKLASVTDELKLARLHNAQLREALAAKFRERK